MVTKFKVGDKVLFTKTNIPRTRTQEEVIGCIHSDKFYLSSISSGNYCDEHKTYWQQDLGNVDSNGVILVKPIKSTTIMSGLIEKFRLLSKGEPEASFIKAGVQEMDGDLTDEGRELYDVWRFEQDKEKFNTDVVQKIIAAEEAKKAAK